MTTHNKMASPSWLNEKFMEQALREGKKDPKISVKHIDIKMATTPGDNYASIMYRVPTQFINGSGDALEQSFVIKTIPDGAVQRKFVIVNKLFEKEAKMFMIILPEMAKILQKVELEDYHSLSAEGLFSTTVPERILILQDLAEQGFKLDRSHKGFDLKQSMLVMSFLGRFHAASVILKEQDPTLMNDYMTSYWAESKKVDGPTGHWIFTMMMVLSREIESWPGFSEKYAHKVKKLSETLYDKTLEAIKRDDDGFNVLNHADVWGNNVMFKYSNETNQAIDIRVVDYQMPYYASPAIDLIFFLYTSISLDVRDNHIEDLLSQYHSTLIKTLHCLNYKGKTLSYDELKNEIEKRSYFCMYPMFVEMPLIFTNSASGLDIENLLKDNVINDDAIPDSFFSITYKSQVQKLLPIFDKKGFLQ